MPDIRIDYATKPAAYVEAVVDIDTSYAAMDAAIFKGVQKLPSDRIWWAHLSGRSNVNEFDVDCQLFLKPAYLAKSWRSS